MIKSFKHKGLQKLYERGTVVGIQPEHVKRLRHILKLLSVAGTPQDLSFPGLGLHKMKGDRKDIWSVKVSGNWRVTFTIKDGDIFNLYYEDYH